MWCWLLWLSFYGAQNSGKIEMFAESIKNHKCHKVALGKMKGSFAFKRWCSVLPTACNGSLGWAGVGGGCLLNMELWHAKRALHVRDHVETDSMLYCLLQNETANKKILKFNLYLYKSTNTVLHLINYQMNATSYSTPLKQSLYHRLHLILCLLFNTL